MYDNLAVRMNARELGKYVLEAKDDEWIAIALNNGEGGPEIAYPQAVYCSHWYLGCKHFVQHTDSYIFFIDFAGGGNPAVCDLDQHDETYNEEALIRFFETWLKDTVEQMDNCADVDDKGERVAYLEIPKPSEKD